MHTWQLDTSAGEERLTAGSIDMCAAQMTIVVKYHRSCCRLSVSRLLDADIS